MLLSVIQSLFGLIFMLIGIAMFVWFFWAVGSAFESDSKSPYATGFSGSEIGGFIGLVAGIAFFVYYLTL